MDQELINAAVEYMQNYPVPDYFENYEPSERAKRLFQAMEEIKDEYPQITVTPRMMTLQALYNAEGEEEGIAMMHRQGVSDYTVKDVKTVLKRENLSPYVLSIIRNLPEMQASGASGRVGWLI